PQVLAHDAGNDITCADRYRALVDDGDRLLHRASDALGRLLDVDEIRLTPPTGGRTNGDEDEVGGRDSLAIIAGEDEPATFLGLLHQLLEAGLVDGGDAGPEPRHFRLVDVDPDYPVAELGQADGRRQPDVTGADHRNCTHCPAECNEGIPLTLTLPPRAGGGEWTRSRRGRRFLLNGQAPDSPPSGRWWRRISGVGVRSGPAPGRPRDSDHSPGHAPTAGRRGGPGRRR